MIARRELILGGVCLAAAGTAYQLYPHRRLNLLGARKMGDIVPIDFGEWASQTADELVRPETEGKLAAKLYSEIVSRVYANKETGDEVMMLIAYGDTQSDLLQLHRPESCYPAVGFRIASSERAPIPIKAQVSLPGRRVVAERTERQECIVYWTRLGEHLPAADGDQRAARLSTAMQGYVPDGALFRFSALGDLEQAFQVLDRFISELVLAVKPNARAALVGTETARRISA